MVVLRSSENWNAALLLSEGGDAIDGPTHVFRVSPGGFRLVRCSVSSISMARERLGS